MDQPDSVAAHFKANIVLYGALAANLGIAIAKFAAAAISTYYWYRLPGPASLLPDWFPLVSHLVTTPFFFWFLVLRNPKVSWLKRPVMASNYWSSRFESTANKNLIRVSPGKA